MHNKYCRLCWNTSGWCMPTGERAETGKSYVAEHGFGHEEWLFNYEWLIDGIKFGFLQPIGKHRPIYAGHTCSITLYTLTPEKDTLLIGRISHVTILNENEMQQVLDTYTQRGWLDQMREHVTNIKGAVDAIDNPPATAISNIRFAPEDVQIFDPRPRVVENHTIVRNRRYHPLNWIGDYPDTEIQPPPHTLDDPRRSEDERKRAAQEGSTIDPKHVRLQNRLYERLCELNGSENVFYERDYVDLIVSEPNGDVYFEIKTATSAKHCIRLALGQLLEYSHYPDNNRAARFVVVGDAPASEEDHAYLVHLRKTYHLPIYYGCFFWETNDIGPLS